MKIVFLLLLASAMFGQPAANEPYLNPDIPAEPPQETTAADPLEGRGN